LFELERRASALTHHGFPSGKLDAEHVSNRPTSKRARASSRLNRALLAREEPNVRSVLCCRRTGIFAHHSERFVATAGEVGVDESGAEFEQLFRKVASKHRRLDGTLKMIAELAGSSPASRGRGTAEGGGGGKP
jgi:hypothetical protein